MWSAKSRAQASLFLAVIAWWTPPPVAWMLASIILLHWIFAAAERMARRWVFWVPTPWTPSLRRYARRAAEAAKQGVSRERDEADILPAKANSFTTASKKP